MKTFLLMLSGLFLPGAALLAQDTIPGFDPPAYRPSGKFYVGGFLSPDLSYSIIPRDNTGSPAIRNFQPAYDVPKFSVTVGLEGLYQINSHLALSLGVQYSGKGGRTKEIEYTPVTDADPVSMYYVYDYRYVDVPLRLDVYFTRRKVTPFLTTGVSSCFFINQRTSAFGINRNDEELEVSSSSKAGFSAVVPQVQAGAGVDIALRYTRLRIFPIYRLNLMPVRLQETYLYSNKAVDASLYSFGLGIHCFFGL